MESNDVLILKNDNCSVSLKVSGYENATSDSFYDSNWLILSAQYHYRKKKYLVKSPCLLSSELAVIQNAILKNSNESIDVPLLEAGLLLKCSNSSFELSLWYDLIPPWLNSSDNSLHVETFINFYDKDNSKEVVLELLEQSKSKFPVRG